MNRKTSKITWGLAAAIVAVSVAPPASAAYVDLRSPDARTAAAGATHQTPAVDLRSPDARDAARVAESRDYEDLRSPDTRDAGRSRSSASTSPATASESSGFDWDTAAIAAGGVLVVLGLGGKALVTRRRESREGESASAREGVVARRRSELTS